MKHKPYAPLFATGHSADAERLMLDPSWMPGWTLSQVLDAQNVMRWEVRESRLPHSRLLGRGDTECAAIRDALACKDGKP